MTRKLRTCTFILALAGTAWTAAAASAQNVTPVEGIRANGTISQPFALTAVQRNAIYDAVIRQKGRTSGLGIAAAVGSPVPAAAVLHDLPVQAGMATEDGAGFKYARVEDQVLVVDPLSMTVVDVIGRGVDP